MKLFILGTRKSALALAQTLLVQQSICAAFPDLTVEVRKIETIGDKRLDLSLTEAAGKLDKGLFTKELEEALLDGRIDAAVHSLKDLPTTLPTGLRLAAVLPRANTADLLISKTPGGFSAIPLGATIATSSVRRQLQIRDYRSDLTIVEIRGNVSTRLKKLATTTEWSATVLAAAGLERLGFAVSPDGVLHTPEGVFYPTNLTPAITLPAAGQGAIGIEVREHMGEHTAILQAINHLPTWQAVTLERTLLRSLGGGCQMPLGVRSYLQENQWTLDAVLFRDGKKHTASGHDVALLTAELLA